MFGLSTFDAVNDGAIKDTLNFDELLDDSADDTLSALEGALCCDGKDECCDECDGEVDFEDEDDPEDANDYFPGEPIADIDDDDDPEEEEDEDYDDIVDGTDIDGFIEGFDDDDDPEEFEDDELGEIARPSKKCKGKCAKESTFDGLFTDDDIATEGSAFEPKMDPNNFNDTYFRDTLDIESTTDRNLLLFDEEDDDEDEDDMGVELGLESSFMKVAAPVGAVDFGFAVGTGALIAAAGAPGAATGLIVKRAVVDSGLVFGIEKLLSIGKDIRIEKRTGKSLRYPTEDELREFYSAALKAATVVAKDGNVIGEKHHLKKHAITYYEPKDKDILKKMRKCKGALGFKVASISEPSGTTFSKAMHHEYLSALEEIKNKVSSTVPSKVKTYIDENHIFIFMTLD